MSTVRSRLLVVLASLGLGTAGVTMLYRSDAPTPARAEEQAATSVLTRDSSSSGDPARLAPAQLDAAPPAPAPDQSWTGATDEERNTIRAFKLGAPATVFVTQLVTRRGRHGTQELPLGSGTGFIWDRQGHVVTNFHVVRNAQAPGFQTAGKIEVTLHNKQSYAARVVGVAPFKDVAVLKIDAPAQALTPVGRPDGQVKPVVGQKTIAIGNPFGLDHTLTTGVISALDREVMGVGEVTIRGMIQTDAAINPGNSGGPLLNSAGQLLGMNTMIFTKSGSSAGIGFAVPYATIARVVPQLIKYGQPIRPGLGIELGSPKVQREMNLILARARIKGVPIFAVERGTGAAKAKLRGAVLEREWGVHVPRDVITAIDGKPVENFDALYNALDAHRPGDVVQVSVHRIWEREKVTVPVPLVDLHAALR